LNVAIFARTHGRRRSAPYSFFAYWHKADVTRQSDDVCLPG
jgi:hypothetical protein